MHESALARAALPAPTVCLGMLLKEYSLAHELWLLREGNKVITGEGGTGVPPVTHKAPDSILNDLPAAVLICCQSWDQLKSMRSDPLLSLKINIWKWRARRASRRFNHGQMRKDAASSIRVHPCPSVVENPFLEQELAKFLAYRNDGLLEFRLSQVPRPDSGPPPRLPGTPFILRLQQWLMVHLRLSEAQAWDYPVGLAKMRWVAHWEQEGGLQVFNAHDAEQEHFIEYWEARGGPSAIRRQKEEHSTTDKHG